MERQMDMGKLLEVRANTTIPITQAEYDNLIKRNIQLIVERDSLQNKLDYYESNWLIKLLKKIF